MKHIKYALIILLLYAFFLVTTLPASIGLSFVQLPEKIKLSSVSGTIWSGAAKRLQYSNSGSEFNLGALQWELHPLSLIFGILSADVSLINDEQYFTSEIRFGSSAKVELEETRFMLDLSSLQALTYGMPFSYSGKVSGYFPVSFIHKNHLMAFNGQLSLSNLNLTSPQQASFGDIVIEFQSGKEGSTSAVIKDTGGPLDISGQLTLSKNALLNLTTKLAAREAGSSVDKLISFVGKKDARGRVQFNYKFQL